MSHQFAARAIEECACAREAVVVAIARGPSNASGRQKVRVPLTELL
jgi:hypothetical protein